MTKQEFEKITRTQLEEKDGKLHYGGYLDLEGTQVTSLPEGLTVGGYLDLEGTQVTSLPEGLTVGGYLDLEGTQVTSLPDNLTVGGYLDLEGTQITTLPDNLTVGGDLYLRGTQITSLPDNLTVGGYLDLEGTQITTLPDNLTVGGDLYLRGTQITSLPDNLTVGGDLYLRGTQITSLPEGLTVGGYLDLEGTQISQADVDRVNRKAPTFYEWRNKKYIKADGIFTEVVSHKGNVYKVKNIGSSRVCYLITDGRENWSHGETLREAKEDLVYKITKRDKSEYKGLSPDTEMSLEDGITCYRTVTGACAFGTKDFVKNRLKEHKDKYTIDEIAKLTEGEYGNKTFKEFFNIK